MTIRLEDGAGARIAGKHEEALTTIQGAAAVAPKGVDGGEGTPQLLDILVAVSGTADSLSRIQGVLGKQVRAAAGNIEKTDDEVARGFNQLNGELS